jgi:REP element-mobilizing transposase RayT
MNRAIARRTMFTDRADIRFFLSRLAREVRRGRLEIHAYAILTTHYHLLVKSPLGMLSEAMRVAQNEYVRWFNRRKRRDGGLLRGRFRSRPIDSLLYWDAVVRYIDTNPVRAGLVSQPKDYPHASARFYMGTRPPPWLKRSSVETRVAEVLGETGAGPAGYVRVFGASPRDPIREVVERRIESSTTEADPLDDLLQKTSPEILDWMRRKARLADGTAPGLTLVSAEIALGCVARRAASEGAWRLPTRGNPVDGWPLMLVGVLRDACALPFVEIGGRVGCSTQHAMRRYARHREMLLRDDGYALKVTDALREAVRSQYGVVARLHVRGATTRRTQ